MQEDGDAAQSPGAETRLPYFEYFDKHVIISVTWQAQNDVGWGVYTQCTITLRPVAFESFGWIFCGSSLCSWAPDTPTE